MGFGEKAGMKLALENRRGLLSFGLGKGWVW